jgi:acyl-CoA thioester hydrolase
MSADWDLPAPFIAGVAVASQDIDAYRHVNNTVYMTWFDRTAWAHSAALELPIETCLELDYGMVVVRSVLAYLRPAKLDDEILVATWILPGRSKVRLQRRFQVRRAADTATLARADIEYACIELSSGRPARWPPEFSARYVTPEDVVRAHAHLAPL